MSNLLLISSALYEKISQEQKNKVHLLGKGKVS